jgi:hypothetical protein
MGDLQDSGITYFSEGSFFGTPSPNTIITVETPGIAIPQITTFLSDEGIQ